MQETLHKGKKQSHAPAGGTHPRAHFAYVTYAYVAHFAYVTLLQHSCRWRSRGRYSGPVRGTHMSCNGCGLRAWKLQPSGTRKPLSLIRWQTAFPSSSSFVSPGPNGVPSTVICEGRQARSPHTKTTKDETK